MARYEGYFIYSRGDFKMATKTGKPRGNIAVDRKLKIAMQKVHTRTRWGLYKGVFEEQKRPRSTQWQTDKLVEVILPIVK